jgi:hypothetical protein
MATWQHGTVTEHAMLSDLHWLHAKHSGGQGSPNGDRAEDHTCGYLWSGAVSRCTPIRSTTRRWTGTDSQREVGRHGVWTVTDHNGP